MRAGKLNKLITIQAEPTERDTFGQRTGDWTAVYTDVPASIEPIQGSEKYAANQFNAETSHLISIRHEGRTVTPLHRVKYGERYFEIISVINVGERNREYRMECSESIGRG